MALDRVHLPYTRVDGTMLAKHRQLALESFIQDPDIRIILISLRCGANGYASSADTALSANIFKAQSDSSESRLPHGTPVEPYGRGSSSGPRAQDRADEGGHDCAVYCSKYIRRGNAKKKKSTSHFRTCYGMRDLMILYRVFAISSRRREIWLSKLLRSLKAMMIGSR